MGNLRTAALPAITAVASLITSHAAQAADAPPSPPSALGSVPNASAPPEATLPFARRNIWNWEADGQKGIWVQALGHQWYYGKFLSPCTELPFRNGVHFRFGPSGELDKWSAIIVPHYPECSFISFILSDGPPKKVKKPPAGVPTPAPAQSGATSGPST
jgi:hypothetical protein